MLDEAIKLKNQEDYRGAARVLSHIVKEFPTCTPAFMLLGGLYLHEFKKPRKAVPCFEAAIGLAPRSEMCSLGLFHSLWNLDRVVEALEELKRFQMISHSKDYDEILAELKEKWLADE